MTVLRNVLFILPFICIILALVLSLVALWQKNQSSDRWVAPVLTIAAIGVFANLMVRWAYSHYPPFTSLYEFALWFVFGTIAVYLFARRRIKGAAISLIVSIVLLLTYAYTGTMSSSIDPLMPALKSPWLTAHVITAIAAYGAFSIAFATALLTLIKLRSEDPEASGLIPAASKLDRSTYGLISFGFVFQSLLLITGAVWAEEAWGRWWGWDPKETWALITWFIYAIYLHGYTRWSLEGSKSAIFSIIGFAAMIFTMFGVSYLLGGMHAY